MRMTAMKVMIVIMMTLMVMIGECSDHCDDDDDDDDDGGGMVIQMMMRSLWR